MTRRIALAILITVWAILIAGCATAYLSMRRLLVDQLDISLKARAEALPELRPAGAAPRDDESAAFNTARNTSSIPNSKETAALDHYVIKNRAGVTLSPPAGGWAVPETQLVSASFFTLADGTRRRSIVLTGAIRTPGGGLTPVTINYQSSAVYLDGLLNRLAISLTTFGIAAGLVTALVALKVSRAALKPLYATAEVIGTIDPRNLDRRIDAAALPPELASMAQRLNEMLERIERAYVQRHQFLADASHELRTPVAALVTTAEVSLRHPRTAQAYQQTLATCLDDARYLRRLVERLMEQCRADTLSHDETPEEVDLTPLLTQCADQAAAIGQDRGVSILRTLPAAFRLTTQPQRLRSIVTNLLSNAVEYNRPGGQVELLAKSNGRLLHLTIRDTGPGISPEHVPHLFEPFYRADQARSNQAGHMGLGLSLVQAHLCALGGQIRVESALGEGTMFHVELPLQHASTPTVSTP
jgi:two-component system heavy metal sensor histidine kinase CusS